MAGAPAAPARAAPTLRGLLGLAWPIVVSRSAQVVDGLADATMVAHLGEGPLAATTAGALNAFLVFILPMGTVFIVSSFSSQLLGRGDLAGARRHGWYGLAIAAATQVGCVVAIPGLAWFTGALDLAPEVRAGMSTYLAIRLWSGGAVVGLEALGNYYGGIGNTALPMRAQLLLSVVNVATNWLLIDGRLGLPALGVAGAAWSSVVSSGLAFAVLLGAFVAGGRRGELRELRGRELWRVLRFGVPSGFNWFLEFAAFMFFVNVVVTGLGTTALAALMAVIQVNAVAFMPAFALASAGAILVGQAIGAGEKDDVPRLVRLTFLVAGAWQAAVGLAYLALPAVLFAPFARGPDPGAAAALLEVGARMLAISAGWQLFDAAANTVGEGLRAAGDTAFILWARAGTAWVLFAPGSWISVRTFGGGEVAAMLWLTAYLGVLALVLVLRFRGGAWRRIELVEPAA